MSLPSPRRALLLAIVLTLAALVVGSLSLRGAGPGPALGLDDVAALVGAGDVVRAELHDEDAVVVLELRPGAPVDADVAHAVYPASDASVGQLIGDLVAAEVPVQVRPQAARGALRLLVTVVLPLVLLAELVALLLGVGREDGSDGVRRFGTVGATTAAPDVRFADVAGVDRVTVELRELVDHLRDPARFAAAGATAPRGVLLLGPPGCGKTLLARAVAGEAGVPFFPVAGAQFVESLVGVGAARVRDLFATVRASAPAIVFIDELDAVGRRRGTAGAGSEEREQTLNQLLVELDGFDAAAGVVVIGATNRADILDPALLRPGRFDRHVTVERPDRAARRAILELHARERQLGPDVDLDRVAARTAGCSGADLAGVLNEAVVLALRDDRQALTAGDVGEALERVLRGTGAAVRVLDVAERRRLAVHDAARTVIGGVRGQPLPERLSIVSRRIGGERASGDDRTILSVPDLRGLLVEAVAGDVAEGVLLGSGSTASERDREHATELARRLVGRLGAGPRVGAVRLAAPDRDVHLGGAAALGDVSEAWWSRFDDDVADLVAESRAEATRLVLEHRPVIERLAEHLAEHESLDEAALLGLLAPSGTGLAPRA